MPLLYRFASKYLLSCHNRYIHLKTYAKVCDICGKTIYCKDLFERHMLQHEGRKAPTVTCDVCGLILTDEKALKRHKSIVHPEGGQKEYACTMCSKISPNLMAHKRHVKFKHEMGYDHICTICNKAFKRAQTLKVILYLIKKDFITLIFFFLFRNIWLPIPVLFYIPVLGVRKPLILMLICIIIVKRCILKNGRRLLENVILAIYHQILNHLQFLHQLTLICQWIYNKERNYCK